MLARFGFQQDLVNLKVQVMRQQRAEHQVGAGFKQEFRRAFEQLSALGRAFFQIGMHGLDFAHRQQRPHLGLLRERGNEIGEQNIHRVRFALDEQVLDKP